MEISEGSIFSMIQSDRQFHIDFDDVWEWLDFSTKGNAKRSFENAGFIEGTDFEVFISNDKNRLGGRPEQIIRLTIDCFKTWAMMVNTDKGKKVRLYFVNCEKRLKQILQESYQQSQEEARRQLVAAMVGEGIVSRDSKFDSEFYELIYQKRGNGWQNRPIQSRPSCVGKWTNQLVYNRMLGGTKQGGVKDKLNDINPRINGRRKDLHHEHLKPLGQYHLKTHLETVKALARISPDGNWERFMYNVQKGIPNGEPLQLHLWEMYEQMELDGLNESA